MLPARDLRCWSRETADEMSRETAGRVQPLSARRRRRGIEPRRRRAGWKAGGPSEPRGRRAGWKAGGPSELRRRRAG